jgi:hypothetical protein
MPVMVRQKQGRPPVGMVTVALAPVVNRTVYKDGDSVDIDHAVPVREAEPKERKRYEQRR